MLDYNKIRRKTREVNVGGVIVGGNSKISIQSMTNTDTRNAEATLNQISALKNAGCNIVRITVPDLESAETVRILKEKNVGIPIVADIHFDYKVALKCAEYGVDKIRINPGNIGDSDRVKAVCDACRIRNIPIRVGVNGGSLEKSILAKYGSPCAEALAESALYHVSLLEQNDFYNTVISMKSSNPAEMIKANRIIADKCDYPIHLGVTEAGNSTSAVIKSSVGVGSLLCDGIGDTIRISLTEDPVNEVKTAKQLLNALGVFGQSGMDIVSCPTCGRTKINLIKLSDDFKRAVTMEGLEDKPIKVALMGCIVNGPGEARDADIGIAGGNGEAILFSKGEIITKIKEDKIISTLIEEIKKL